MRPTYYRIGAVLLPALLASCQPSSVQQDVPQATAVRIMRVAREATVYLDQYPGTLVALNEVTLHSEVNGFLTSIDFREGESVRRGQKLYEIERSKYLAAYQEAKAGRESAKTNLVRLEQDAQRYTSLLEQNAVARQRYDYAMADLADARQRVAAADARVASAATDLRHAVITAPFAGTIGISQVKQGAFVGAGQTALNTLSSDDPVALDFAVPEGEMARYLALKHQGSAGADSTFTVQLPDGSTYPLPGRIWLVDRAVDPQMGTLRVRLVFPNPDRQLKPGLSCVVRVRNLGDGTEPVVMPYQAVQEQMGEYFVYVVKGDTARQRRVRLGARVGGKVVVRQGLAPGEQIVWEGMQRLREGTRVAAVAASGPAATTRVSR